MAEKEEIVAMSQFDQYGFSVALKSQWDREMTEEGPRENFVKMFKSYKWFIRWKIVKARKTNCGKIDCLKNRDYLRGEGYVIVRKKLIFINFFAAQDF